MTLPSAPRPLEPTPETGDARLDALARLVAVVDRLRAPDGCPWDLEQTVASMAPSLVEEAHEAVEAIEAGSARATAEELGDVLLVVTLAAKIADQDGSFSLADVARGVADKLIRRHPHVFGDAQVSSTGEVLAAWERIKQEERRERDEDASVLAGVPVALPALQRAARISKKACSTGFRWDDAGGALRKVEEEAGELREAFEAWEAGGGAEASDAEAEGRAAHLEHELGDLLIAAGFLGQYVGIDPERAARGALRRFEQRFRHMEAALGDSVPQADLATWMAAWRAAKVAERDVRSDAPPA